MGKDRRVPETHSRTEGQVRARAWNILAALLVLLTVACGGGDGEAETAAEVVVDRERVPQGTQEAQAALEGFLSSPFITETQAELSRDMAWRLCVAFDQGVAWQEFEDGEKANREAQGAPLSDLELTGVRTVARMGTAAYCPEHADKTPPPSS